MRKTTRTAMTAGVWIGFDEKKSLGAKETGAKAALPIWMDFMTAAASGKNPGQFQPPPDLPPRTVAQKLDTSDLAPTGDEIARAGFELVRGKVTMTCLRFMFLLCKTFQACAVATTKSDV